MAVVFLLNVCRFAFVFTAFRLFLAVPIWCVFDIFLVSFLPFSIIVIMRVDLRGRFRGVGGHNNVLSLAFHLI